MSTFIRLSRYRAYLLRCWEEGGVQPDQLGTWRFSLEDTRTGQRRGFATLKAMVDCLQTELANEDVTPQPTLPQVRIHMNQEVELEPKRAFCSKSSSNLREGE